MYLKPRQENVRHCQSFHHLKGKYFAVLAFENLVHSLCMNQFNVSELLKQFALREIRW